MANGIPLTYIKYTYSGWNVKTVSFGKSCVYDTIVSIRYDAVMLVRMLDGYVEISPQGYGAG
jgi:hypothetical protein